MATGAHGGDPATEGNTVLHLSHATSFAFLGREATAHGAFEGEVARIERRVHLDIRGRAVIRC